MGPVAIRFDTVRFTEGIYTHKTIHMKSTIFMINIKLNKNIIPYGQMNTNKHVYLFIVSS